MLETEKKYAKSNRKILLALLVLAVAHSVGCVRGTAKGYYGPTLESPGQATSGQQRYVILSDVDVEDTRHAVGKALGILGVIPEVTSAHMTSGFHLYEPNPFTLCPCTYAIYFQPTKKGKTEMVLLTDGHE